MSFAPDDDVTVVPVELDVEFAKRNFLRRFVQERIYGAKARSIVTDLRPDVIISGNTPIEIQAMIQKVCRRSGTPFLFWLQDVYSIGIKSILSRAPVIGPLIAERYAFLDRSVARGSDGIVVISDDFRDLVADWGVDPRRITVIENWGVLPTGTPPGKDNAWAACHGLLGKRVLLYSGALGFKHNPRLFLDLAMEFRDEPDVRIVVISEGYGAEWLALRCREFPGLVLLPFQAVEDFEKALGAADILIAVLEKEAAKYSVPSKILSYMTAGKPILAAIPAENSAARRILAASAGVIVDPQNPDDLRRQARSLIEDEQRRTRLGAAALDYGRANFDIDDIARRFEEVFYWSAGQKMNAVSAIDGTRICG